MAELNSKCTPGRRPARTPTAACARGGGRRRGLRRRPRADGDPGRAPHAARPHARDRGAQPGLPAAARRHRQEPPRDDPRDAGRPGRPAHPAHRLPARADDREGQGGVHVELTASPGRQERGRPARLRHPRGRGRVPARRDPGQARASTSPSSTSASTSRPRTWRCPRASSCSTSPAASSPRWPTPRPRTEAPAAEGALLEGEAVQPEVIRRGKTDEDEDEGDDGAAELRGAGDAARRRPRQSRAPSTATPGTTSASAWSRSWRGGPALALRGGECNALVARGRRRRSSPLPQTFMNRSGYAARCLVERYGLAPERVLVVSTNRPAARRLRLRPAGGPGGHRGLGRSSRACGRRGAAAAARHAPRRTDAGRRGARRLRPGAASPPASERGGARDGRARRRRLRVLARRGVERAWRASTGG